MVPKIIVATGNQGKLREIGEILNGYPCTLISMTEYFGYTPDIDETGTTFQENAQAKVDWVYEQSAEWTLADDSGLVVDVLGGMPGVRSARYAGEDSTSEKNNMKLLTDLEGVAPEKRTARFICSVVLRIDDTTLIYAEGRCEGRIIGMPRGTLGFGYDPLFIPEGFDRTFAELTNKEKNLISHRGKALLALREKLYEIS